MKFNWFLFTIFIALCSMQVSAQRWTRERNHLVIGFGATGFMGDLGGADAVGSQGPRDFNFPAMRPGIKLGYRYYLLEPLALTGNLAFGYVYGDDKLTDEKFRNTRNIHFRSPILESSVQGEYYFWTVDRLGDRYRRITRSKGWVGWKMQAYLFAGIGGFYYEPQAFFEAAAYREAAALKNEPPLTDLPPDGWYNLRPLRTEGQGHFPTRDKYIPVGMVVPMGVGLTFNLTSDFTFGLEYGFRKTFTDYIDDVSTTYPDPTVFGRVIFPDDPHRAFLAEFFANPTLNPTDPQTTPGYQRANPHNDDAYMFLLFTVSYKLPERRFRGRIPGL